MRKPYLIALLAIATLVTGLAQADEVTISTYYPAPYGVYNNFEVKGRSAVGDISSYAIGDVENLSKGELWIQDSMILEPKDSFDPATEPAGKEGELVYSSADDLYYYYNGDEWVAQGSILEKGRVISLRCAWGDNNDNPSTCVPMGCPGGWLELGWGCEPVTASFAPGAEWVHVGYCERLCYKE